MITDRPRLISAVYRGYKETNNASRQVTRWLNIFKLNSAEHDIFMVYCYFIWCSMNFMLNWVENENSFTTFLNDAAEKMR